MLMHKLLLGAAPMSAENMDQSSVAKFPLVHSDSTEGSALVAIVRRLSVARSVPEIMDIVAHSARTLIGADGITFVLRDGDRCYYAEEDAVGPLWKGQRFPMSACISGWCMIERRPAVIPDIYQDSRIPHDAYRPTFVRSLAMVPVRQDDPIAALGAYWANSREIQPREVELLQTIADAASLAVAYVDSRQERQPWPRLRSFGHWLRTNGRRAWSLNLTVDLAKFSSWRADTEVGVPKAIAVALGSVFVSSLARLALGALVGSDLIAFATYYPAVLLSTLWAGTGSGLLAMAVGGVVGWYAFVQPVYSFEIKELATLVSLALYVVSALVIVWVAQQYRTAAAALAGKDRERELLTGELLHRMRNMITVVQAIIKLTLSHDREVSEKLARRIAAAASSDGLMHDDTSFPSSLTELLTSELTGYERARFILSGPETELALDQSRAVALSIHELATNAVKYGALSCPEGRVLVSWKQAPAELQLVWQELGGPPVTASTRDGFGSQFVRQILAKTGGSIKTDWLEAGVVHRISLPNS
jgi:two-component sensor histidine kinase